jgi:type I restriction-modification system DNA methylase subunit
MVHQLSLKRADKIFEPCGGDGVFVDAILSENKHARIDVCELNHLSFAALRSKFSAYPNVAIRECDTLLDEELSFSSAFGGLYDKIIANPPYGAWVDYEKRNILKRMYPNLYTKETYTMFLYRCIALLKEGGMLSFIIPDTFLSLHTHKAIRQYLLSKTQIRELVLLPSNFFPNVNFGYANLAIITLKRKNNPNECLKNSFRVIRGFTTAAQLLNVDDATLKKQALCQENVLKNPDSAFFITGNDDVQKAIREANLKIGDVANCVTGFYSGDDKRFLQVTDAGLKNGKNYNMVDEQTINTTYQSYADILDGIDEKCHYIPIVKGGNVKYLKPECWFMVTTQVLQKRESQEGKNV